MDSPTWRFLKSEVMSRAIQLSSGGELVFVDEVGYDFVLNGNVRIELKSQKKAFNVGGNTAKLKLKNTQHEAQALTKTFDFLMVIQTMPPYRVCLVGFDDVSANCEIVRDGIKTQIPEDCLINITPKKGMSLRKVFRERIGLNRRKNSIYKKVNKEIDNWISDTYSYYLDTLSLRVLFIIVGVILILQ